MKSKNQGGWGEEVGGKNRRKKGRESGKEVEGKS